VAAAPPSATTNPAPTGEARVPTRSELPPDLQRQLPPLVMSGSVYSADASKRMVIVDGRLVFEGEQAAGGVTVERVNPKSVVLRFQNARFSMPL
jgi:general secretion pathway protein B